MMLNKKITLFDMESVDNSYYNSLIYVKDNDPSDLELTFSVDDSVFGEVSLIFLVQVFQRSGAVSGHFLPI